MAGSGIAIWLGSRIISPHVVPAKAGPVATGVDYSGRYQPPPRKQNRGGAAPPCTQWRTRWDPGLRRHDSRREDTRPSNPAREVLLPSGRHVDQPPPHLLD